MLKADVRKYFETVDHKILLSIMKNKIKDSRVIWLIKAILSNYTIENNVSGSIGMPLGNLTSQFFANIYLNELDQFVKHKLKIRDYIRYVDDFVLLHKSRVYLENCKDEINKFLKDKLSINLHPEKSRIIFVKRGVDFLGQRIFCRHKILRKKNLRKFKRKLKDYYNQYNLELVDYDKIYDYLEGWCAYARNSDTYNFRKNLLKDVEQEFSQEISTKEINKARKLTNI